MINKMVERIGIDRATAEKVANFFKEHADEVPNWLAQAGLGDKLGGLGNIFGQ